MVSSDNGAWFLVPTTTKIQPITAPIRNGKSFSIVPASSLKSICVPTRRNGVFWQWCVISGTHYNIDRRNGKSCNPLEHGIEMVKVFQWLWLYPSNQSAPRRAGTASSDNGAWFLVPTTTKIQPITTLIISFINQRCLSNQFEFQPGGTESSDSGVWFLEPTTTKIKPITTLIRNGKSCNPLQHKFEAVSWQ